ncbi:MAG: gamma-glutamyltransferase family protein [Pseudomonadota bacterium]
MFSFLSSLPIRVLNSIACAALLSACGANEQTPATDAAPAAQSRAAPISSGRWFISAANPLAVEAGADILRRGGSAVDAAIATQAVLGLVEPQSSGLGGGAFMVYFDPEKAILETFDGRETAPASATPDRFLDENGEPMQFREAVIGGLSVGVPGAVRMLEMAHADYGVLPWSEPWQGAAALAEEGFNISPRLHGLLDRFYFLKQSPAAAAYFYDADGNPHPEGYLLKNPAYAETVRTIAAGGADAFYTGPIAEAIVEAVNTPKRRVTVNREDADRDQAPTTEDALEDLIPGGMTLADLANYRALKRTPVCGEYRQYEVCSMAPPSSGGVTLLQILMLLERFDMAGAGAGSVEALHLILEASRLAYADRAQYLADQDQTAAAGGLTQDALVAGLLNPPYIAARSALIDITARMDDVDAGDPSAFVVTDAAGQWNGYAPGDSPEPPSTSHFTIIDGAGRVVSMTTTVESVFGSNQMAAGMILNNQLTDFSFSPTRNGVPVANAVAGGKRPRSSMSPVIIFDPEGNLWAAVGSPGGPAIIGFVVKTVLALIDWEMQMQPAIDLPHVVVPRGKAYLEEDGFDAQIIAGLEARGHEIATRALTSGLHGFKVNPDGSLDGGADPRREGTWQTGFVENQN